ncbi:MAG: hypothetical protein B0D92_06860 [Spirochaeta sp. LUC14_002_19_P3]|nr:MAG: hypothetical protein B0D92_06860 [Spirochaeta sp. LUC14_002_19_P3]
MLGLFMLNLYQKLMLYVKENEMKARVSQNVNKIVSTVSTWSGVKAVVLQHFAERDIYDPNFSVSLDVYQDGDIPNRDERSGLFPDAQFFESSHLTQKDRFILQDMPIRISYKSCHKIDEIIQALDSEKWLSMESGTYMFYRIATGVIEWARDDWMEKVVHKLDQLPNSFWKLIIDACQRRIEHYLGDLGASSMKDDALYFNLSLSGYLQSVVKLLFAVNHTFESGPRDYTAALPLLEIMPDGFEANWTSLLRENDSLPPERKREIAELLTKSLFSLIS